jgi:hypothetical protein
MSVCVKPDRRYNDEVQCLRYWSHMSRFYWNSPGFMGFKELCSGVVKKFG